MQFVAPPIRTPFLGNPPDAMIKNGQKDTQNVPSYAWESWFQKITTTLTAPVQNTPPATSAAAGTAGQIAFDANFLYVAVAKNSWKRIALSAF